MTPRQLSMLLAVSAIWGGSYLLIKIALDGFEASMLVFARVALAALFLWVVILLRGGEDRAGLTRPRRSPARVAAHGVLMVGAPFLLIAYGETEIGSGLTAVLIAASPLFVALVAPFVDPSERAGREQALGIVVGLVGVALLVGVDSVGSTGELLGALAMVLAALSYAVGSLNAKRLGEVPALPVSFAACAIGAVIALPPALAGLGSNSPDLGEAAAVVSLALVGTAVAFVIYFALISEAGAAKASLVGYLVPLTAVAYGAVLLDEEITPAVIAGLVLILAGVFLAGRGGSGAVPETG
jgi:drug/metabolite transporter (DMT)-like permease